MKTSLIAISIVLGDLLAFAATEASAQPPLYAGTRGDGKVYAYQGGTTWTPISDSLGCAVLDIIQFEGSLYAATTSDSGWSGVGQVWRYGGGTLWTPVGDTLDQRVSALEIYNGQLYAGTAGDGGKLYRYEQTSGTFDYVGTVPHGEFNFWGIGAMYSSSFGYLQLGDIGADIFGHYDGNSLHCDVGYFDGSCVRDYAEYNGKLYAAADFGLRGSTDGIHWSIIPGLWAYRVELFQNRLYLTTFGELAYMDSSETKHCVWTPPYVDFDAMVADGNTTLYLACSNGVHAYAGTGDPTLISDPDDPLAGSVECLYIIPEPAMLTLLALGGLAVFRRRWK